jgi:hypothetical protein
MLVNEVAERVVSQANKNSCGDKLKSVTLDGSMKLEWVSSDVVVTPLVGGKLITRLGMCMSIETTNLSWSGISMIIKPWKVMLRKGSLISLKNLSQKVCYED